MRITQNAIFNTVRRQMMTNSGRLVSAQETVATQKKINRLSDDPIGGGRAANLTGSIARAEQYIKNIDRVAAQAGVQDSTLGEVQTILGRAKELLLGEANEATSSAASRGAARLEIEQLTAQLVQVANTRFEGKYIFSGFATDTPAFSAAGVYQGDSQTQMIEVQPGTSVAQNTPGDRVFGGAGVAGGVDLFAILNQASAALSANDQATITNLLGQFDSASTQITTERSNTGSKVNLLEALKARQDDVQANLKMLRSDLEDADLAEAMTKLTQQQTAYEATLASAAKIVQPSLLDFLR